MGNKAHKSEAGNDAAAQNVARAEHNRQMARQAIFGQTAQNPNIQKSFMVLDGDKDYSSSELQDQNKGS